MDKIRDVIGSGGKVVRGIQARRARPSTSRKTAPSTSPPWKALPARPPRP
ncbi:MAG: hypothetical protein ACLSVD_17280 [Eggerthellaceae bacterium]